MPLESAIKHLDKAGEYVNRNKKRIAIQTIEDMAKVPNVAGCYWIETTMAVNLIFDEEISNKKIRKSPPPKTEIVQQIDSKPYIIYNGTHNNINKRLQEHLFNKGNKDTGKLGIKIHNNPHQKYEWFVYYFEIKDLTLRNALENWWRYNIGWPVFCKR